MPAAAAAAAGIQQCTGRIRAAPQRGCVGRHLAYRNEMRVSGSDSYALFFSCSRAMATNVFGYITF